MRAVLRILIRGYQLIVSPWLGPRCRFHPSCSNYALEALEVHGTRRGLWLTVRRLLRCRPFGPSGWDPVPEPTHDPVDDTVSESSSPRSPRKRALA